METDEVIKLVDNIYKVSSFSSILLLGVKLKTSKISHLSAKVLHELLAQRQNNGNASGE